MKFERPKDLEGIFLDLVDEFELDFNFFKKDLEYEMEIKSNNKEDAYIGFSSDKKYQHIGIIDKKTDQCLSLFLLDNKLTTSYIYSDHKNLKELHSLCKDILFFRLLNPDKKEDEHEGFIFKGPSIRNQKFNYDETKKLVNIFINYLRGLCKEALLQYN